MISIQRDGLRPQWRNVLIILAILVVAGFAVASVLTFSPSKNGDFSIYYRAGQAIAEGRSPYFSPEVGGYVYAPAYAYMLFQPLSRLPLGLAVYCYLFLNWVALGFYVFICVRLARSFCGPQLDGFLVALLALIPTGAYLRYNLYLGQVSIFLSLACAAWFYFAYTGRSFLAGFVLSLAIALKIYPVVLVPVILMQGDRRAFVGLIVGLGLAFMAPAPFIGIAALPDVHIDWINYTFQTQYPHESIRYANQSLLALLARLPLISNGFHLYSAANLTELYRWYPWLMVGLTIATYAWFWRRYRSEGRHVAWSIDLLPYVCFLLMFMTILAPRAWPLNFAAAVLPAFLMAAATLNHFQPRWLAPASLLLVLIAVVVPTPSDHEDWRLLTYIIMSKHFWACTFLAFAVLRIKRPSGHEAQSDRADRTQQA